MGSLSDLLGLTQNADGTGGISVNVNANIAPSSLVGLFVVGCGIIAVGVIGSIIISLVKKKSA